MTRLHELSADGYDHIQLSNDRSFQETQETNVQTPPNLLLQVGFLLFHQCQNRLKL